MVHDLARRGGVQGETEDAKPGLTRTGGRPAPGGTWNGMVSE